MRGMNCERAAEFLPLHAAGDLEGRDANEVASHIIACGDCRRLAEEFRESRALLVEAFETPEFGAEFYESVRSSVLERIAREREPSTPSFVAALFGRRLAYATTFAVALFALALALQHFRGGVRETPQEFAQRQQNVNTPKQEQRGELESPHLPNAAVQNEPTPKLIYMATSPRRESTRRITPDRPRESRPKTVARDDESAMIAQVTPSSINDAQEAGESASPADAAASQSAATAAPEVSRIEIQTADPNIRIIWLAPPKSEAPNPNEPENENGERK
jgi:hypothetical protein